MSYRCESQITQRVPSLENGRGHDKLGSSPGMIPAISRDRVAQFATDVT